jgi:hypothetical protein
MISSASFTCFSGEMLNLINSIRKIKSNQRFRQFTMELNPYQAPWNSYKRLQTLVLNCKLAAATVRPRLLGVVFGGYLSTRSLLTGIDPLFSARQEIG